MAARYALYACRRMSTEVMKRVTSAKGGPLAAKRRPLGMPKEKTGASVQTRMGGVASTEKSVTEAEAKSKVKDSAAQDVDETKDRFFSPGNLLWGFCEYCGDLLTGLYR